MRLLQVTVLPFITVSIVTGIGQLDVREAKRLGLRAGAVLAGVWALTLGFTFLFPLVLPDVEQGSFFRTSLADPPAPFDLLELYIPANPFHSLANNVVPAVVVFSVLLGLAMLRVPRKDGLLEVLRSLSETIATATHLVVRLMPWGVFVIAAHAAGTLDLQQLSRIQIYLVSYAVFALAMALWVLPGLVAALTTMRVRDVLGPTRDALLTAFVAGDVFIVLPMLTEACRKVLAEHRITDRHTDGVPDVLVPASFNFPHAGKLLSLSFVLFAGWLSHGPLGPADYPALAASGVLSLFGSVHVAIPFLLDLFRVPADTFELFLATGVLNARFGTLVAAVHVIVLALLGSAAVVGALRFRAWPLLRYAAVTTLLAAVTVGGLRTAFATVLRPDFDGARIVYGMEPRFPAPEPVVRSGAPGPPPAEATRPVLENVRARGLLRVCVLQNRLPFVFVNGRGAVTGLDVELAGRLARDLRVSLELLELVGDDFPGALRAGSCDLALSGLAVTPLRAAEMVFSQPYLDETFAFLVRDDLRDDFAGWDEVRALGRVRIGMPAVPYYVDFVRERAPGLEVVEMPLSGDYVEDLEARGLEAAVLPAERASVYAILHPRWTVVVPKGAALRVPLGMPVARGDRAFADFLDTWIELKRRDGTLDALYRHWILGENVERKAPRWSVVRNVLGWVD